MEWLEKAEIMILYYTDTKVEKRMYMTIEYFINNGFNEIIIVDGEADIINVTKTCNIYKKIEGGWLKLNEVEHSILMLRCKPSAFKIPKNSTQLLYNLENR